MPAAKTVTKAITIPAIDIREMTLKVVGDSPLIMHAWDDKIKRQMLDKMMGKAVSKGRDIKNPVYDFMSSMYWLDGAPEEPTEEAFGKAVEIARFGFPCVAFKASAVSAGFRAKVTKDKVSVQGAFHINGCGIGSEYGSFVEIKGIPRMREDMVRVANGAPDIRYRGEFPEWEALINVRYNAGAITDEQIANLFNLGGFAVGVGEWRPEKGGMNGMYHVA